LFSCICVPLPFSFSFSFSFSLSHLCTFSSSCIYIIYFILVLSHLLSLLILCFCMRFLVPSSSALILCFPFSHIWKLLSKLLNTIFLF
jgi:hypothetical protein